MPVVELRYKVAYLSKHVDFLVECQFGGVDHNEAWHDEANKVVVGHISPNISLDLDADVDSLLEKSKLTIRRYRRGLNLDHVDLALVAVFRKISTLKFSRSGRRSLRSHSNGVAVEVIT